jgi:diguanylate cyclase (GGDEF)-like protein
VVVVVGEKSFADRVEALHAGADVAVDRPLDEQGFARRVTALLERGRAEPSRVLSVEDDPDQGEFVRSVLESGGYVVKVCRDPGRFEADVIAFRPDLVLLDVNLPGVSGYDLARFLRQNEAHAALPVVFLTGEGRDDARIRSVRAGGDDHLVKPVAPGLLLSTVTARLERARTLRALLSRDGLTGLSNHTAFLEGLRTAWKRNDRSPGRGLALVSLDLDSFKSVNDRYGHPTGDRVLASLGALLRRRLRGTDLVGRLGGEEFGIVLEDLRGGEAVTLLNRLLDEFSKIEFAADDGAFRVTFSAGISCLATGMSLEAWRSSADEALYAAKRAGRSRVVLAGASPDFE